MSHDQLAPLPESSSVSQAPSSVAGYRLSLPGAARLVSPRSPGPSPALPSAPPPLPPELPESQLLPWRYQRPSPWLLVALALIPQLFPSRRSAPRAVRQSLSPAAPSQPASAPSLPPVPPTIDPPPLPAPGTSPGLTMSIVEGFLPFPSRPPRLFGPPIPSASSEELRSTSSPPPVPTGEL